MRSKTISLSKQTSLGEGIKYFAKDVLNTKLKLATYALGESIVAHETPIDPKLIQTIIHVLKNFSENQTEYYLALKGSKDEKMSALIAFRNMLERLAYFNNKINLDD